MTISLLASYDQRSKRFFDLNRLTPADVAPSRLLFDDLSLIRRVPIPKRLDVRCFVCGLPFDYHFTTYLGELKSALRSLIGPFLHYLVRDSCQAIELAVTKWPSDTANSYVDSLSLKFLRTHFTRIRISTNGIQIHDDGSIVLRCLDENSSFRLLRSSLMHDVKSLTRRQSSWVHIPIGRILEPIPPSHMRGLQLFCIESRRDTPVTTTLPHLHFVHEHRWYQTDITLMDTIHALH